jgi:hypothetical protein
MERTERSLLLDAIVLYESMRETGFMKVEQWEVWKKLALEVLYPERVNGRADERKV